MKLLSCPVFYFLHNQVSSLFRVFRCVKNMKLYSLKIQQKHKTFVVSGFMLFTQPNFMLFRVFRYAKSMKLYTQKVQQEHETFVVSGLVLFTQQKD
jgi:hypothetical protein